MITRRTHLWKGVEECLDKMYRASQPSITWNELCEKAKQDKEKGEEHFYWEEHYLSQEEYDEIYNEYAEAYRAVNEWKDNCDTVIKYLTDGGIKDKWIEREGDSPGYRGYENVAPIKEQIQNIVNDNIGEGQVSNDIVEKITNVVMNTITTCKDFYRFDRDGEIFSFNVGMYAPNTNIKSVRKYHEKNNTGIVIRERKYNEETDEYEYID